MLPLTTEQLLLRELFDEHPLLPSCYDAVCHGCILLFDGWTGDLIFLRHLALDHEFYESRLDDFYLSRSISTGRQMSVDCLTTTVIDVV